MQTRPSPSNDSNKNQNADADRALQRACARGAAGDEAGAEAELRALMHRYPEHRATAATLAHALAESGRPNAAAQVIMQAWTSGAFRDAERDAAAFLRRCNRFDNAYAVCRAALKARPDNADMHSMAGKIALNLGRFDEALEHLRSAVTHNPEDAAAWLRIAHAKRFGDAADPDFALLQQAARRPPTSPQTREAIGFALGKASDDLARYPQASLAWDAANRSCRSRMQWSSDAWHGQMQRLAQSRWPANTTSQQGFRPIFVVGSPRSGTTLMAELLAKHFGVRNRGETHWLAAAEQQLRARAASTDDVIAAAEFVARHLRSDDVPATHYLDKNPMNFRHVGLIRAMFPAARIVWMQRDERDTALSLWMQFFAHAENAYAYAWPDIAAFLQGERAASASAMVGDALAFVRYEDLVSDPHATLKQLADFLELDMGQETARPDGESAAIATASLWQARQPIHSRSVGRWRHYENLIPELQVHFPA